MLKETFRHHIKKIILFIKEVAQHIHLKRVWLMNQVITIPINWWVIIKLNIYKKKEHKGQYLYFQGMGKVPSCNLGISKDNQHITILIKSFLGTIRIWEQIYLKNRHRKINVRLMVSLIIPQIILELYPRHLNKSKWKEI